MQIVKILTGVVAGTLSIGATSAWCEDPSSASNSAGSVWEHHQETISYVGITSLYTCDGLETKVKTVLKYFGARPDLKVDATGCPDPNRPSGSAWVKVDFYSLTPASSSAADAVEGEWHRVALRPNQPSWMGAGECELMAQMKKVLTSDFSLRSVEYRASCFPHDISLDSYAVTGEVLKPVAPKSG